MLTKDIVINQAIEHLQKAIRKGAVSNEYMHTGRVHKEFSSVDAKKQRHDSRTITQTKNG